MSSWYCPHPSCNKVCLSPGGLTQHLNTKHKHHEKFGKRDKPLRRVRHPLLDGTPCDQEGYDLESGVPPPSRTADTPPNWGPFDSQIQFETADFLFKKTEMSQGDVDILMRLWASTTADNCAPFENHHDMLAAIDSIKDGDAPWRSFSAKYSRDPPRTNPPDWMVKEYTVYYRDPLTVIRNMISNPSFDGQFDYSPYREFENELQQWTDVMSGDWAWEQANKLGEDPDLHGAMMVPLIVGSDKTLASNATGLNEFHPLYISPGNVKNSVRRAHCDAVIPIGFLAIPKSSRKDGRSAQFRSFRRQLIHESLKTILRPLRQHTSKPDIVMCPDGRYRRAVYLLGPYIADYPEQVILAGVVSGWCVRCASSPTNLDQPNPILRSKEHTNACKAAFDSKTLWEKYGIVGGVTPFTEHFPHADIYELITPDLLHQLIKGVFKDHLVEWVVEYLQKEHGKAKSEVILDEIDRRIALAPPFPGLRRFKQGRNFQQWTGNDSKALMKVWVSAIEGFVPQDVLRCFHAYLDFCYIARMSVFTKQTLDRMDDALERFHRYRTVFQRLGVREEGFSLPRQHAMAHYRKHIENFGAPNGLCSSITESKHITAVKRPWRRSSRYNPIHQIMLTNRRMEKLTAARAWFTAQGLLKSPIWQPRVLHPVPSNDDDDQAGAADEEAIHNEVFLPQTSAKKYPLNFRGLGQHIGHPNLPDLIQQYLSQADSDTDSTTDPDIPVPPSNSPRTLISNVENIKVFHSARAVFCAPSNPSATTGMYHETMRATPSWNRGEIPGPRYDCIFVSNGLSTELGMGGLLVARVLLFFSFTIAEELHQCALVHWFSTFGNQPDADNGMWVVTPDYFGADRNVSIIHVDSIVRAAHLLPIFDQQPLPHTLNYTKTLDAFRGFYVNKYIDYHAYETVF